MKFNSKNVDMGQGPLFVNIIRFAIPFLLAGILQQSYSAADVIVVGRFAGEKALAGVGTTSSVTSLILSLFLGLSVGVSVAMGRALGSKDKTAVHETVHTAVFLSIAGGAVISVVGILFVEPLLKLIAVPDNVMPQAKIYMQIIFAGQIPSLTYNFCSAILRAKGDTKRPLYIVTISGFVNVLLNVLFVVGFDMKAEGVALATVLSQVLSAILILCILSREKDETQFIFSKIRIYRVRLKKIVSIGIPSGLQSLTFSTANIIVQSCVNGFGSAAIAGSAAASDIGAFYQVALNAFGQASVSFVSHNVGAKRYDRVKRAVMCCFAGIAMVWIVEAIITVIWCKDLISIYAPGNNAAIEFGYKRHMIIGTMYGIFGFVDVLSGALRGLGHSFKSMVISVLGVCGTRVLWIFTAFEACKTFSMLYMAYPISWGATAVIQFAVFVVVMKNITKTKSTDL